MFCLDACQICAWFLYILGYDTDDEYEEHDQHLNKQTRWVKGQSYKAVPIDGGEEDPTKMSRNANTKSRHTADFGGLMYNRYTSKSESNLNTNTRSQHSAEYSPTSALGSGTDLSKNGQTNISQSAVHNLPSRMATNIHYSNAQYHDTHASNMGHSRGSLSELQEEDYIDESPPKPMSYVRHPAEGGIVAPSVHHPGGGR